jgi:hypothetical protein
MKMMRVRRTVWKHTHTGIRSLNFSGFQVPVGVDVSVPAQEKLELVPDLDAEHIREQSLSNQAQALRWLRQDVSFLQLVNTTIYWRGSNLRWL